MSVFRLILVLSLLSGGAHAQDVFDHCGMTGTAKAPEAKVLNPEKDRYDLPTQSDFDPSVTLDAMLKPGHDSGRFTVGRAAEITGYVYDVKQGGKETCNCGSNDLAHTDTHIELTLDGSRQNSVKSKRVIVEVTPRLRRAMMAKGVDWSTTALQKMLLHHSVKVQGWMFYDAEHEMNSENMNPNGMSNWRATVWEIHPITSIQIVGSP